VPGGLVGREEELSRLRELVAPPYPGSRVLLLLGDPGAGKTRNWCRRPAPSSPAGRKGSHMDSVYSGLPNKQVSAANGIDYALLQRLSCLQMPVFVANGDSDPMILPHYSYLLAGLIPRARVKIYPDSAHGFLFQHHAEFAADVEAFLGAPG
jgi:pimeloyl-ACP methyl ester carboxylesterase